MRELSSTCGSRGDVEPVVRLAVQLGALGAECAAAEERDAPVAAGVMPNGGWR